MKRYLYKIIDFPHFDNENGSLAIFQPKDVPFNIKRVFTITDTKSGSTRGGHTHHKTIQVLVCIRGGCIVDFDNGKAKKSIALNKPYRGLVLYPYVWHTMRNFKPNTVLLCLANTKYSEKDYIRTYEKFLNCLKSTK